MSKRREWTLRMKRERDDRLKKKTENSREIVESIKCWYNCRRVVVERYHYLSKAEHDNSITQQVDSVHLGNFAITQLVDSVHLRNFFLQTELTMQKVKVKLEDRKLGW